jgi:hypothetical protein
MVDDGSSVQVVDQSEKIRQLVIYQLDSSVLGSTLSKVYTLELHITFFSRMGKEENFRLVGGDFRWVDGDFRWVDGDFRWVGGHTAVAHRWLTLARRTLGASLQ